MDYGWNSNDVGNGASETLVTEEYDQLVTSPSIAVIEAIAAVEDVDPIGLSTLQGITLHDYVDPDALDRIFANGCTNNISITLLINEYRVWIESDKIAIADRETNSMLPSDTDQ